MGRQLNIRSDRAYALATAIAGRRGKSITEVVEAALAAYDEDAAREQTLKEWQRLLELDRAELNDSDFKIEDLYDPETGLPV